MYANISITTDNQFSLYVNGNFIGQSDNIYNSTYSSWESAAFYPMVELESDVNVFAVSALNDAGGTQENPGPSPAGVLAGIAIALADADADVASASPSPSAVPSVSLLYIHKMTRMLKILIFRIVTNDECQIIFVAHASSCRYHLCRRDFFPSFCWINCFRLLEEP